MPETSVAAAISDSSSSNAYVRLHVSPLDAELLPVVLNSTLLPKARNISFHTLETFPERRYGFVELPKEDADKVRKKFNGAVLRGNKMKVDPAKPDKTPAPLGEEVALADEKKKEKKEKRSKKSRDSLLSSEDKKKSKKRKREEITGVVLEEGRQVKRGWTSADEPKKERKDKRDKKDKKEKKDKKDKKKQRVKSKYTDHDECLVKTVLPPNKVANTEGVEGMVKKKKKDNKREVVVHEFAKTTKFPTFLKAATTSGSSKKAPPQFDEEKKCWVDEDGNVVEEVKATRKPTTGLLTLDAELQPEEEEDDSSSSSSEDEGETRIIKLYHESSSEDEDEDEDDEEEEKEDKKKDDKEDESGSEAEEKSEDEKETKPAPEPAKEE